MNRAIALLLALLGTLLTGAPALAHPSYGIVADGRGNVYFSDLERVWKLAPDGSVTLFRPAMGAHVHELALAANGDIIGGEGHYEPATGTFSSGIWSRSPAGVERYLLAPTATPPRGRGLLLDAAGNSYTTQWPGIEDRRTMLFRRSPDGRVTLLMGDPRAAASFRQALVSSIGGMAFDPAGALVFADTRALRRADRSGAVTTLYEGEPMTSLRGVAVAADGSIYAADIGDRRLLGVTPGGLATTLYRSEPGWAPSGVAVSRDRVFVLEAEIDPEQRSNRVRVVEVRDGVATLAAMAEMREPGRPGAPAGTKAVLPRTLAFAAAALLLAAGGIAWLWRRARNRGAG